MNSLCQPNIYRTMNGELLNEKKAQEALFKIEEDLKQAMLESGKTGR
jgi:hypothetical protein